MLAIHFSRNQDGQKFVTAKRYSSPTESTKLRLIFVTNIFSNLASNDDDNIYGVSNVNKMLKQNILLAVMYALIDEIYSMSHLRNGLKLKIKSDTKSETENNAWIIDRNKSEILAV